MARVDTAPTAAPTVCAVVVTHNRPDLLARCLDHLGAQSRKPDAVVVVDNASTDDTPEVLSRFEDVHVVTLPENSGGSGGFHRGVQEAYRLGHDWLWLLDDDTLADARCLEMLLAGAARAPRTPRVMASVVRWRDGRLHPMNRPWLRFARRTDVALAAAAGLVPIRTATFVSALVHRAAVAEHGLPPGHFFVWLDDIRFTARVLRDDHGYMVPESVAWHWTTAPYSTLTDSRERFYYKARNHLWVLRSDSFAGVERLLYSRAYIEALVSYLRHSPDRREAMRTTWRGVRDGLRREPA